MLERGEKLYSTFIDYSAAFDSVSHKFLDRALKRAGASNKTRVLFRAIYRAASAYTEVNSTDDTVVRSQPFPVNRGVIQGDILSPLFFILALELILKYHDNVPGKGVQVGGETVHTLGYADDAALLDASLDVATARVSSIAQGSREDADMDISIIKTKVMQVMAITCITLVFMIEISMSASSREPCAMELTRAVATSSDASRRAASSAYPSV